MKKLILVFAEETRPVNVLAKNQTLVDNAEVSGANGRKTDAIGY